MVRRLSILALVCAAALTGCGDDSSSASNALSGDSASISTESGPTISGTPTQKAVALRSYRFTPVARGPQGSRLQFTIQNKPQWADFNDESGELSGTPDKSAVGTFDHIVIGVSDGHKSVSLNPFHITVASDANAPTIEGKPDTTVVAGQGYRFEPTVADADGDNLTFNIKNKPTWASFDTTTGELTGKPSLADVGTVEGIVITVSDGTKTASLPAFEISISQAATASGSATVSWDPPTTNTDGSVLTDLTGYKIYYGTDPSSLNKSVDVKNAGLTSYEIEGLGNDTWYFAVKAVSASNVESALSAKASKTIS
jgi:hypothetical protein